MYAEHSKSQLWGIVEHFTSNRENNIIREIFINNRTMVAVAREQGITIERVRQTKEKRLRRLRIGKAKRELLKNLILWKPGHTETVSINSMSMGLLLRLSILLYAGQNYRQSMKSIKDR